MLEFVKSFMRIDFSDDDAFLASLIEMSKEFIKNATGYTIDETKDFDNVVVAYAVNHFYENRDSIITNGPVPQSVPFTLKSLFSQLQHIQEGIDNAKA